MTQLEAAGAEGLLALTLRQPWAWMVMYGSKDLENRVWVDGRVHRLQESGEPFFIHAGLGMTRAYYEAACDFARFADPELVVPPMDELVLGAMLGRARITQLYHPDEWRLDPKRRRNRWHMKDNWGWQLADRTAFREPVLGVKGLQRFWRVSADIAERCAA